MEAEAKSIEFHLTESFLSEVMNLIYDSTRYSILNQPTQSPLKSKSKSKLKPNPSPNLKETNPITDQEIQEGFIKRIDQLGYKVGYILSEKLIKDKPRLPRNPQYASTHESFVPDSLEVIKFICKDLWLSIFNKQVDNLRTNHRGVYVLQDYGFKPFLKLIPNQSTLESKSYFHKMLVFPSGIIRGSLMNLGIQSQVIPDQTAIPPQCSIQIRTILNHHPSTTNTSNQSKPNQPSNSNQTSPTKPQDLS
ncbi:uncharacterized protein MELLADRAFT_87210 [Melampsora larici-populina 98AG31]|uniref:Trafficking protein particle complex subunit 6B n=1 Tax=Melampsora larici-populina (strain 98AG31 / pathotype 3-4-7) TaxID=747676 RepID=F4R4X5_MELLP|nr:uncharacterized protein MELLADRAFT_87210 [Melampsora larici-populina 98AG31]EGG12881.1 hypothetical protein MELLADRAFT_87210 [Melampsora larici-populina 98AG31]